MKPPLFNEKLQVTPLSVTAAYVTNWAHSQDLSYSPFFPGMAAESGHYVPEAILSAGTKMERSGPYGLGAET